MAVLGGAELVGNVGLGIFASTQLVLLAEEARDWAKTCGKAAAGSILLLPALPASRRASVNCSSPLGWIPQGWMSLAFLQLFKEQIW